MVILKRIFQYSLLLSCLSCAKISYLTEQGIGQVDILWSARKNHEVLEDPKVSEEYKAKIKQIETYKTYFYNYWQRPSTDIYSKTTLLKSRAVTYLVIASRPNEIKARKECFTFYGCFPYLGFFKEESATEFAKGLEREGYETYTRDVLAYSTLGNFDDPILSSFFEYGKYSLTETVFHELFHTIFFAKSEVDLNENLANYFGEQMLIEYYKDDKELDGYFKNLELNSKLKKAVTDHAQKLKDILKQDDWENAKKEYLSKTMPKELTSLCTKLEVTNCWPAKMEWNTASLAAFMTYEKSQSYITQYAKQFNGDLKALFANIEQRYEKYLDDDIEGSFENYLFNSKSLN
ncbi:aminopeptidase [Halobacteriovorax sp. ZH5_bin.2]|uniref:aminopeptidase n=1 Tax=unclassified Halobacteriovorax TaxID=2639665 RepID=UPI0037194A0B